MRCSERSKGWKHSVRSLAAKFGLYQRVHSGHNFVFTCRVHRARVAESRTTEAGPMQSRIYTPQVDASQFMQPVQQDVRAKQRCQVIISTLATSMQAAGMCKRYARPEAVQGSRKCRCGRSLRSCKVPSGLNRQAVTRTDMSPRSCADTAAHLVL